MKFLIDLILSLLGLEKDPFVKSLDADKVRDRWKELEKEYSNIKWVPKTLTKTISKMEDSDFGMDCPVLIAENICHYQNPDGGWGKNGHYAKSLTAGNWIASMKVMLISVTSAAPVTTTMNAPGVTLSTSRKFIV